MRFEWDPHKDKANRRKHGLSFAEARRLFASGTDYLEIYDEATSTDEARFIAIGPIGRRIAIVVWTERKESTIRIISARWATKRELELYRKYMEER